MKNSRGSRLEEEDSRGLRGLRGLGFGFLSDPVAERQEKLKHLSDALAFQ